MSHYRTNLRDIDFNLFEVQRIDEYLGIGPFEQMDVSTARDILREVDRLARDDFAASFVEADRTPVELTDGEVRLSDGLRKSLDAFYEGGWHVLGLPSHMGGVGAPPSLMRAAEELLVGANPTAYFYAIGNLMAKVIDAAGTPEQSERFAKPMIANHWGGTMVLTEPDAGSDVGAGTTKATHIEDDAYHLEGVKHFITGGEHDYSDNIIHLVLARRDGGPPGTKGLSMFIVPKFLVGEDGSIGERNGIVCTNIEQKMGLKGSSTSELTLGRDRPCIGYLVGNVHKGIRQMFHVIEEARMMIGIKSVATLSTGYLNALAYAKERLQGADMTQVLNKDAPRVPIIDHPDVRRMLMSQKAHAEGMRALVFYTAWVQDQAQLHPDDDHWHRLDDLLLPLVKGYSSEKGYEQLALSLQVLGGSGFTQDYPIEQYIRDAKIDTLYEGTTGIQALDLFFRKIVRDQGATLTLLAEQIRDFVKGGATDDSFARERGILGSALEDVQAHIGAMVGWLMQSQQDSSELYKVGFQTNSLLEGLAEVIIGWLLLRHAEIATAALSGASGDDRDFYAGKVAAARWFVAQVLPKAALRRQAAEAEDGSLMDLADGAF